MSMEVNQTGNQRNKIGLWMVNFEYLTVVMTRVVRMTYGVVGMMDDVWMMIVDVGGMVMVGFT